jgi:type II secretory pathway pseudopilin PulG
MRKSFKKNILDNSGFTILEMTVVIFIIVVGLTGIITLAHQNVQTVSIDKNTLIASQLAQEGLETVRAKRDTNWLQGANWETSTTTGSRLDILQLANGYKYTVDATTGLIGAAPAGINDPAAKLYLNAAGLYTHQVTATSTSFSRLITVGHENNLASTSVICQVQWKKGISYYSYYAETVLYNWK